MRILTRFILSTLLTLSLANGTRAQESAAKAQPEAESQSDGKAAAEANPKTADSSPTKKKRRRKLPIAAVDYAQWERLGNATLSHDGKWVLYTIARVDEKRALHLHRTDARKKKKKDSPVATYQQGERPVFSDDSQWLAVTIGKSPAEIKKAKKAGSSAPSPTGNNMKLRHLESEETTDFESVKGIRFSADSRFLAIEVSGKSAAKPSGPPRPGTPPASSKSGPASALVVRNLATKTDLTFGNVVKHAWSDRGALLAMVIDSPSISNALQILDPATGTLRVLESSDEEYSHLAWRKDSFDLAAMREMKHGEKEDVCHVLLAWRDLQKPASRKLEFNHTDTASFPDELFIAAGGLSWPEDGEAIFCDLKKWEKKPKALEANDAKAPSDKSKPKAGGKDEAGKGKAAQEKKKSSAKPSEDEKNSPAKPESNDKDKPKGRDEERKTLRESLEAESNVEVWHSKDVTIMPRQKKKAGEEKNPKLRAVWWPERDKFIQLTNELTEEVQVFRTARYAMGTDRTPHERQGMFGPRLRDVYLINTRNGKRERILEGIKFSLAPSPDGRFLLFLRKGQIWSHEVKSGKQRNLTGKLKASFTDQEDDTLAVEKPPFGRGEWLLDGSAVLLYDRYDVWIVNPDGSGARNLTNGAGKQIRHRISRASYHEDDEGFLDPKKPLYVALYGDRSKKTGYARLALRAKEKKAGEPDVLLWDDCQFASLQRARDAGVYTFTRQDYTDSPDLFVADADLDQPRQITATNPFQKNFRWGHSELINFKNEQGVELQGSLTYPANYKPGRKYPMIVYIYEKRSQYIHSYVTPSEKHPYNAAVYSAEGYFVFQPDIVYRPQEPGISALECVVPAVKAVFKTGMIDEKRVGLVGHSWGAYQTAFIVTRSNLFAAGVAGAPLTNMMSMSVSVYWNSGETNAAIFTQSQGRMDQPFWRDTENYIRNSPIHGLDDLKTPLLIAFGDDDGAVDFSQGVQMYNAARWAGKEDLVMLVYPGENHSLRKEENAVDYHYRVLEWFGHYLDRDEAPKWITEGKSFLERQTELEAKKEKKEAAKKPAPKPMPKPAAKPENPKPPISKTAAKEEDSPTPAPKERSRQKKRRKKSSTPGKSS